MKLGTTRFRTSLQTLAVAGLLAAAPGFAATPDATSTTPAPVNQAEVRKALNKLAWYGVFDSLNYQIDEAGNVTLSGEVTRYVTRSDAESSVKHLPGVRSVKNDIEVLPLSYFDDNLRQQAFNAIYTYPALSRYVLAARPSIRIIVKHGDITLSGLVATELDRTLAYTRIRQMPGNFQVTNELQVENGVEKTS